MDIVIFGAGSLGSLVGGLLAHQPRDGANGPAAAKPTRGSGHHVTLVGRDPHVTAVRESGLRVTGKVDVTVHPDAGTTVPASADLAVVTVKAFDTTEAAESLARVDLRGCLSLQNGMGNEERLAERLECPVLAGTCTYGAMTPEPGVVTCTGVGEVVLGPRRGGTARFAEEVGQAFETAGLVTTVAEDMPRRLWEKLAVNAGINATTALAQVQNGALLEGPGREVAHTAAREVAALARREGVDLAPETAEAAVERVAEATAANISSMRQDVLAERRTEVDAISGYVADRASEVGVDTPVNATMAGLLRAWERERF
jgi:2-dehydropantoate 2-reductase